MYFHGRREFIKFSDSLANFTKASKFLDFDSSSKHRSVDIKLAP